MTTLILAGRIESAVQVATRLVDGALRCVLRAHVTGGTLLVRSEERTFAHSGVPQQLARARHAAAYPARAARRAAAARARRSGSRPGGTR